MGEPGNQGIVKNPAVVPDAKNVVGYWRLVDADGATAAVDEKGFQNGTYHGTPTELVTGQPGLIETDPAKKGRLFLGGFVVVPHKVGLHLDEFTIEAWVLPKWAPGDTASHTLFSAGGHYDIPFDPDTQKRYAGFLVYTEGTRVNVAFGPTMTAVFTNVVNLTSSRRTHVAMVMKRISAFVRDVRLLVDGKVAATATLAVYALPEGAPLIIGVSPKNADPTVTPIVPADPWVGQIQEVVLHRVALSDDEIANHVDNNSSV